MRKLLLVLLWPLAAGAADVEGVKIEDIDDAVLRGEFARDFLDHSASEGVLPRTSGNGEHFQRNFRHGEILNGGTIDIQHRTLNIEL